MIPLHSINTSMLPRRVFGAVEIVQATPAQVWNDLKALCITKTTPEVCAGLLGTQALYFAPEERPKIPSWAWLLVGTIAGISILRLLER